MSADFSPDLLARSLEYDNVSGSGTIRIGDVAMAEIIHTSRIKITRDRGPIRIAQIEGFSEPVFYGVHGGIQKFYKVDPIEEHAATLDHIVGAVSA
jgi:hypothetical protein